MLFGGEGEIRTPDTLARMPHFECGAFDHSATSPQNADPKGGASPIGTAGSQCRAPPGPIGSCRHRRRCGASLSNSMRPAQEAMACDARKNHATALAAARPAGDRPVAQQDRDRRTRASATSAFARVPMLQTLPRPRSKRDRWSGGRRDEGERMASAHGDDRSEADAICRLQVTS